MPAENSTTPFEGEMAPRNGAAFDARSSARAAADGAAAPQPAPRQPLSVNSPVFCANPQRVDVRESN